MGHSCEEADDGDSAIEAMRAADPQYDVVLMDNQMPRMMGATATKIMKQSLEYRGIIIGVTGNAMQDDIKEFIENGADDVIIKPLDKKGFIQAITKIRLRRDQLDRLPAIVE